MKCRCLQHPGISLLSSGSRNITKWHPSRKIRHVVKFPPGAPCRFPQRTATPLTSNNLRGAWRSPGSARVMPDTIAGAGLTLLQIDIYFFITRIGSAEETWQPFVVTSNRSTNWISRSSSSGKGSFRISIPLPAAKAVAPLSREMHGERTTTMGNGFAVGRSRPSRRRLAARPMITGRIPAKYRPRNVVHGSGMSEPG